MSCIHPVVDITNKENQICMLCGEKVENQIITNLD